MRNRIVRDLAVHHQIFQVFNACAVRLPGPDQDIDLFVFDPVAGGHLTPNLVSQDAGDGSFLQIQASQPVPAEANLNFRTPQLRTGLDVAQAADVFHSRRHAVSRVAQHSKIISVYFHFNRRLKAEQHRTAELVADLGIPV